MRFAVFDMQVIDPPTGGGRQRLLGLYHNLGGPTAYVGTWDWPGQPERRQMLSATLEEHLVPLAAAQFEAVERESAELAVGTVIDTTFHRLGALSPSYVTRACEAAAAAEVVVFSHPWCWPLVAPALRPGQLLVYDAHNVEGLLRVGLLDDGGPGTRIAREVVRLERALCRAADLVLTCSAEDSAGFARLYGIDAAKTRVAPNGAFAAATNPATPEQRAELRARLGLDGGPVGFFIGSEYGPNAEAARFIAERLAPALPQMRFVVAGGAGSALAARPPAPNLTVTGPIEEAVKRDWLRAADLGLNPMFGGSGTNVKMLDYFAAGLPVVTTPTGARGLRGAAGGMRVADALSFAGALRLLSGDAALRAEMGAAARRATERHYAWERISPATGRILSRHAAAGPRPSFSVVVPTYRRPVHLDRLMRHLAAQSLRDFELIVADQSPERWEGAQRDHGFPLVYVHTPDLRGAVVARNTGANMARGAILAFTDDDCEPHPGWLAGAVAPFQGPEVVGLEGLILSDKVGDPDWRWVTNDGAAGIGFMTANLFVRASAFHRLGGFDNDFEEPHFREDTDLGWRLEAIGQVPFSREAWVFHPPHPRSDERESLAERSRFFEKDALLLRKHPRRYPALLRSEAQWTHNPFFRENLLRGAARYGVMVPPELLALIGDPPVAVP
jgi:GT2 family glycosyltransferase/glycosyltransferase involved in cell wall biosynthesis